MNSATTTRDILSNADIAATCGDGDCATSDAEMTAADLAVVAMVESEAYAAKKDEQRAAWLAGTPAREAAAKAATLAKAPAGSTVCPCCSRAVKVVAGRIVRHGQRGGVNGYTGPAATGMRIHDKTTAPCEGAGRAA